MHVTDTPEPPAATTDGTGTKGAAPGARPDRAPLLRALADALGEAHVLVGERVAERVTSHWDPSPMRALALLRPASTAETAAALRLCHAAGQSVVTQGGRTGLVGGERATENDIVLSLERMDTVESVDAVGRTLVCGAGCPLERAQQAAREAGLSLGLDLGARGSCTIGGNLSTNAGGLSVLRHGMAREQLLGLEAVLADGTVLSSMNRMLKNNAGYDLKHLFVGSEGTLGVITRAVLRLRAATPAVHTALVALASFERLTALLARLDERLDGTLNAFEGIWQPFYRFNTDPATAGYVAAPLEREHPLYAIVEARGSDAEHGAERFERALGEALEEGLVVDAVLPRSERERAEIWKIRENVDLARLGALAFTYDVSLPLIAMQDYLDEVEDALRTRFPALLFHAFGHVADGNLHLEVAPGTDAPDDAEALRRRVDEIVYAPLAALGGSVSAEHGIGLLKKPWLALSRGAEEIALMGRLKRALDPKGILNPGKIV